MKVRILFSLLILTFLAGCASVPTESAQEVTKATDDYLNSDEVNDFVTGNTEEWTKGAGYYSEDGSIVGIWEGKNINGSWVVKDNGEMCITVAAWGPEDCHRYKSNNGEILLTYKGKSSLREMKTGNQLSTF